MSNVLGLSIVMVAKVLAIPAILLIIVLLGSFFAGSDYFSKVIGFIEWLFLFGFLSIFTYIMAFAIKSFKEYFEKSNQYNMGAAVRNTNWTKLALTGVYLVGELIFMAINSYVEIKSLKIYIIMSTLFQACFLTALTLFPSNLDVNIRLISFIAIISIYKYYTGVQQE